VQCNMQPPNTADQPRGAVQPSKLKFGCALIQHPDCESHSNDLQGCRECIIEKRTQCDSLKEA